jgi:predicted metal-binding membrane protein
MNVLWITTLATFVLVEKLMPAGREVSRVAGAAFFVGGIWMFAHAL